jgi:hypothetical protein
MAIINGRESDVYVEVLDLSELEQDTLRFIQQKGGEKNWVEICSVSLARIETTEGLFSVCSEGVGSEFPITEENKAGVILFATTISDIEMEEEGKQSWFMRRIDEFLGPDEIRAFPVKEVVNLADFIERSGSRLERNFNFWNEKLSPIFCGERPLLKTG